MICLLVVLKKIFIDVDETMVHGVKRLSKIIFCREGIEKSDMEEFGLVMFQVREWPRILIICLLNVLKTNFLTLIKRCFKVLKGFAN
jgi:hypothetical protein